MTTMRPHVSAALSIVNMLNNDRGLPCFELTRPEDGLGRGTYKVSSTEFPRFGGKELSCTCVINDELDGCLGRILVQYDPVYATNYKTFRFWFYYSYGDVQQVVDGIKAYYKHGVLPFTVDNFRIAE